MLKARNVAEMAERAEMVNDQIATLSLENLCVLILGVGVCALVRNGMLVPRDGLELSVLRYPYRTLYSALNATIAMTSGRSNVTRLPPASRAVIVRLSSWQIDADLNILAHRRGITPSPVINHQRPARAAGLP